MADPVLLNDLAVWYGGYSIGGNQNRTSFRVSAAELKDAAYGDTHDTMFPGLLTPELEMSGRWNSTEDAIVHPRVNGTRTSWPVSLAPPYAPAAACGADGNLAYLITGADFMYEMFGSHGELMPYTLKRMPRSGGSVVRGRVILPAGVVSATTTGTAFQLGALSATQKLVVALHVFAVTGGTWTLTIESDTASNFPSTATQATFTAATGITTEVKEVTGAVTDTWWRAVLTKSGGTSCNAAVVAGIVNL